VYNIWEPEFSQVTHVKFYYGVYYARFAGNEVKIMFEIETEDHSFLLGPDDYKDLKSVYEFAALIDPKMITYDWTVDKGKEIALGNDTYNYWKNKMVNYGIHDCESIE